MSQFIIENPVLNSPFEEPKRHFRFNEDGITNEIVESRRVSSYFVPIPRPKKNSAKQLAFETEWTKDRVKENEFINRVRGRIECGIVKVPRVPVADDAMLGEQVRCVVSVSMLTEGWNANTVTHILGVRAFGTQLLCEQVVGRGLRRMSYVVNPEGLFDPQYAEVYGVPFSFIPTAGSAATPRPGPTPTRVCALQERFACEITFPRLIGYRYEVPHERLSVEFGPEAHMALSTADVPTKTQMASVIGESEMHAYAKNLNLGFTIPHIIDGEERSYIPDYLVRIDDGRGREDLLNLIVEVSGEARKDKAATTATARTLWVPAVNQDGGLSRWAFLDVTDPWDAKNAIRAHTRQSP